MSAATELYVPTFGKIIHEEPDSICETARLVCRNKKNVHKELTTLEALGVIRFEAVGRAKKSVFPTTKSS
ncbi:HVO_A0114 family putative DNA-binding protein [Haloarcula sebkhae]|uniref:Transcriptional regulator n=1 Tax=Haloarcula sebkhae TaxID=932660 RepID=A0A830EG22_9EURY|nr:hypothetical protein GCM10009067_05500 [Haloarcula sebkhae]